MMMSTAAKPPETKEINLAKMEIIGDGNCLR